MAEEPENKTERIQLLMTPGEVKAIDDWGFKNRIRTRAEAIRRLCRIGMIWDENAEPLRKSIYDMAQTYESEVAGFEEILGEPVSDAPPWLNDYVIATLNTAMNLSDKMHTLVDRLRMAGAPSEMMKLEGDFDEVLSASIEMELDALRKALGGALKRYEDQKSDQSDD